MERVDDMVVYVDRKGNKTDGTTGQDRLLSFLYGHALTRLLIKPFVSPVISGIGGRILDSRFSACFVGPFVKQNHIDLEQYEKQKFSSYNDFFTRKIKAGKRPAAAEEEVLISPCDGKVSVYPVRKNGRFAIKHTEYTVGSLLQNEELAAHFHGGYAVVVRLTVDDYHRYCYVDDGEKSRQIRIEGVLHTVNPVANDAYPIYKMNTREYCLLKTKQFGTVLMMEVGALMVGRIRNYHQKCSVKRGQEKGRFEFGGSTVVLLLEPGRVEMDRDLLENSRLGYETIVKMGEQIGRKLA